MLLPLLACVEPEDSKTPPGDTATDDTGTTDTTDWCATSGFGTNVPWNDKGPYGEKRHDLADDFEVTLTDGTTWSLQENWTGCESYVFVPDTLTKDFDSDAPIWSRDVDDLIEASPLNAHYFFVSANRDETIADENTQKADDEIEDALQDLDDEASREWWASHLHVIDGRANQIGGWLEAVLLRGIGEVGFAIDRTQTIRGMGSMADVNRYSSSVGWFENNVSYAANEVRYYNMESTRDAELAAWDTTEVPLWTGEVISMYDDMEVTLPDLSAYDTFEIEIDMRCPDPDLAEQGNCGAWDYLAYLWVQDDEKNWIELSRFITSYHREAHWIADATPMLAELGTGGETRNFRWEWAPSWNKQPTETRVNLRFSNRGTGMRPTSITKVATGGSFGSTYNDARKAVSVDIPTSAQKVELWTNVTGHGMATNNCAEFCNHQHEFNVDGATHFYEFTMAGTDSGCVDQIEDGAVPNQWGTWWYGRGGWCPGMLVHPFRDDVTAEVTPGSAATVSYRGLYENGTPPDGSGDIVLNSWLVVYE